MLNLQFQRYQDHLADQWDTFVLNHSRNGGIFHERKFLSYHPQDRFADDSLLFYSDKNLVGVLPTACTIMSDQTKCATSHPGSSAGGLVYHKKMTVRELLIMLETAIAYYQQQGYSRLEWRLAESLFSYPTDGELLYLLWHRGFQLITREISSCVNLNNENNWLQMGRKKNPGTIRSLKKTGITVQVVEDPETIYPLIENNLQNRYQKKPTHSLPELSDLKSKYPQRIHFWTVQQANLKMATVVVLMVNQYAVHDFYIAQDYYYAKLNVMPLLFYEMFRHYQNLGFHWFNFGISSRHDQIKWGILEFKEHMGGRATFREVWALDNLANYQPYQFPKTIEVVGLG